jgi:hypothetical protein
MAAMIDLYEFNLLPMLLVSLVVILAASEIGRLVSARVRARGDEYATTVVSATLGLLALMIGFTFSMALSHFDARRDAILREANAIGTTALRGRLLPAPHDAEVLKLLRDYVQIRVAITQRIPTPDELRDAIDRSNVLQEALWQQAMAVAANNTGFVPTGVFIMAVNEMIDSQEDRLTAMRKRVPNEVFVVLYGVAIVAAALAGYASGIESRRSRLLVYLMWSVTAVVIILIQDLDRPTAGFIAASQQPLIDTAASIATYAR